jgi:hypothetical protein
MWICTQHGFVSIVQDTTRPGHLLVRARDKDHLESLVPGRSVSHTPDHDYPWRVVMPAVAVADVVSRAVVDIGYSNFKGRVDGSPLGDTWYARALHRVWGVMFNEAANRR